MLSNYQLSYRECGCVLSKCLFVLSLSLSCTAGCEICFVSVRSVHSHILCYYVRERSIIQCTLKKLKQHAYTLGKWPFDIGLAARNPDFTKTQSIGKNSVFAIRFLVLHL